MLSKIQVSAVSVLCVLAFLLLALTAPVRAQTPIQLWSLDLSTDQDFSKRLQITDPFLTPPSLDFIGEGRIIVSFTDNVQSVPTPTAPEMRAFGFHVLEVDPGSRKLGKKLTFSVLTDAAQTKAIAGGEFVVLAGEQLKKFSDSFGEISSMPIPVELHGQPTKQQISEKTYLNPRYESWGMDVAPGGRELLLSHIQSPKAMQLEWVSANDFKQIAMVQARPSRQFSAGNRAALLFQYDKLLITSSGQETPICSRCIRAYFLTDDLLIMDERTKYEIRTVAGDTRNEGKLNEEVLKFYRALGASRFAYATGRFKGSGFPLRTNFAPQMIVRVFDWEKMKQVAELQFDEPLKAHSNGFSQSAIAVSQDGRYLAVLANATLTLYRLQ
jgi:hypothetical protein